MNTMTDCIHGLFLLCPTNDSAPQPCDSLTHILRQPRNPSFGTDESLRRSSLSRLTGSDLMSTDTPEAPRLYHFLKLPMWLSYHGMGGRSSVSTISLQDNDPVLHPASCCQSVRGNSDLSEYPD